MKAKDFEEKWKENDKDSARSLLTQIEAAKILITNNRLGCEIHIAGLKIGICDNHMVLPILQHNEKEIKKFLKGEPNEYE